MINICICDDDSGFLASFIPQLKACLKKFEFEYYIQSYSDGINLLEQYSKQSSKYKLCHHILFLDIEMSPATGKEIARIIRNEYPAAVGALVFMSAYFGYYNDLYELHPNSFLVKPISDKDLSDTLSKIIMNLPKNKGTFTVKKGEITYLFPKNDIIYLENRGRLVHVHTKSETISYNGRFKDAETHFMQDDFFKCHREFIVNIHEISQVLATDVKMKNGDIVNVSRKRMKNFTNAISKRFGRPL